MKSKIYYYILIPKTKEEDYLDRLSEATKIIIKKNKEYIEQLRKARVAFNNFTKIIGKYAIKDLGLKG